MDRVQATEPFKEDNFWSQCSRLKPVIVPCVLRSQMVAMARDPLQLDAFNSRMQCVAPCKHHHRSLALPQNQHNVPQETLLMLPSLQHLCLLLSRDHEINDSHCYQCFPHNFVSQTIATTAVDDSLRLRNEIGREISQSAIRLATAKLKSSK